MVARRGDGAALAAALLLALAGAAAAACPRACRCGTEGAETVLACALSALNVTVRGQRGRYLNVQCGGGELACDVLPQLEVRDEELPSLGLQQCVLPGPLACVARRLGAAGVRVLTLQDGPPLAEALAPDLLRDLPGLADLSLVWNNGGAAAEAPFPREALAALPALQRLTLRGARLRLQHDALAGAPSLEYLELSAAALDALPAGVFRPLARLQHLALFRNKLTVVDADAFEGLAALERLSLEANPLRSLAAGCFAHTPRLLRLKLLGAQLGTLAAATLAPLQRLEQFELTDSTAPMALEARALAALPALATLRLSRNRLTALPADLLHDSRALTLLDLSRNLLGALPATLLRDQAALVTLDLRYNRLERLERDAFFSLRALRTLRLDGNQLLELPPGLLDGLGQLTTLSLADNRLGANDSAGAYYNLKETSPYNNLLQLRELDLARNRLRGVPPGLPLVLLQLERLDLSGNCIQELSVENNDLTFLADRVQVDLRHNNISTVELDAGTDLARETGEEPSAARVLLDDNPFNCDCRLYNLARRLRGFRPFSAEPRLEPGAARCARPAALAGRALRDVPLLALLCDVPAAECARGCACHVRPADAAIEVRCAAPPPTLPDPTDYGLSGVELALGRAPATLAALPGSVRALNLSALGLLAAPLGPAPPALRLLDLSDNLLVAAPLELLRGGLALRLAGNPLACDCARADAVEELQRRGAGNGVPDLEALRCADGRPLWRVDAAQLCSTRHAALLGGLLAVLGLLVALAALLLHRYALEVRVFLHARGWCRCWVHEEDLDRDRLYDAFVSFAHEDTRFVIEQLLPGLEGGAPGSGRDFRLCVHYRDWIAGEWIPAQIARSVEQSRRTLIVLTPRFLDSVWGRLEFRAAHAHAVSESRSRVIVVLAEELGAHAELDAELRAYLRTNTYLKWGEPWFWERLRYALPHRREELPIRRAGLRLAKRFIGAGPGAGGALDTQLTPDGKIVNAAALGAPTPPGGKAPPAPGKAPPAPAPTPVKPPPALLPA